MLERVHVRGQIFVKESWIRTDRETHRRFSGDNFSMVTII